MKRVSVVLILALCSCSLEPPLATTPLPVPASWPVGDAYLRQTEAVLPAVSYRDLFRDARLQALVSEALVNNRDLMIAAANIAAARSQVRITRANQLPQIDLGSNATVTASPRSSSSGSSGSGGTSSSGSSSSGRNIRANFSADVGVSSFELDLFGRLRSLTRADQQRLLATEAAARAVRLALVADIASAWLDYASDSSLLAIAQSTAASADKSVWLTKARLDGGIAPRTDLLQAQQVLETARQDLAVQRTALAQDVNLLQLLVGAPIASATLPASIEQAAATVVAPPAGLDSRVLLRRPDIVQAEYELRAANAEIGAARAALFPTISLTGLLGAASTALTGLFSAGAFSLTAGAGLNFPIFNAGAGRARVALTQAQRDAALASYEKAIQTAFREVADALADRGTVAERLRSAHASASATAETLRLVDARYRGGIDPYLTTLDAQRSYYAAERAQVAVQLSATQSVVSLYRALGADANIVTP